MVEQEKINAEVISVFPNKVKISVDKLEDFCLAEEKLKVGSYLRIADNDNAVLIAKSAPTVSDPMFHAVASGLVMANVD